MQFNFKATPLVRAIIVGVIVLVIGWIGLDIPRDVIEDTVDSQLQALQTEPVAAATTRIGTVASVVDGDTVYVEIAGKKETVRLIGIDTPEVEGSPSGAECYGAQATAAARALLSDQTVIVTTDPSQHMYDQYDRLLAYLTLEDGRDVGEALIINGVANEFTYDKPYAKQAAYKAAEAVARAATRGIWSACL